MARANLQVILDILYKGGASLRKASQDLERTEKTVERGRTTWEKYGKTLVGVGATFGTVMIAGKQLYDALGEGAELVAAEERFHNLAMSIDSTGDAMLGKLKDATQGMVSDAELVASAGQIMSLGLQDTEDGVVRLATVAGNLGWDMQQTIMTMANNSVMRLDALGLSIEAVQTKARALQEQGMDADQAFDLAVIEAGEEKYALLGNRLDTTAGQMELFETAVKNAQDEFKIGLVEGFADGLGNTAEQAAQAADDVAILTGAVGGFFGAITGKTLGSLGKQLSANEIMDSAVALGLMSEEYSKILMQDLKRGVPGASDSLEQYRQRVDEFLAHADSLTDSWQRLESETGIYGHAIEKLDPPLSVAATKVSELNSVVLTAAGSSDGLTGSIYDLTITAEAATFDGTIAGLDALGLESDTARNAIIELNNELDLLNGRTVEAHVNLAGQYTGDFSNDMPNPYQPTEIPSTGGASPTTPLPEPPRQEPEGANNVTINNYNQEAAATNAAMLDQMAWGRIS